MSNNEETPYNYDILWLVVSGIVVILSILALILDRKIWLNIISGILLALAIITFIRTAYNMYLERNTPPEITWPTYKTTQGVGLEEILPDYRYTPSKSEKDLLSDVDKLLATTQQEQEELYRLVNETYALLNNMDNK